MGLTTLNGDVVVTGQLVAQGTTSLPSGTITNAMITAAAGIDATKVQHELAATYAQASNANAAAETKVVHVARAAGTVVSLECGLIVPPDTASGSSGRTATFDLKKNNTTVLTGTVVLDSTNTARIVENASISVAPYVDGDVFELIVTVAGSVGTHCIGVFAQARFRELST